MNRATGVIASKARSMLGSQLHVSEYEELLHKRNVAEIAGYLKNSTAYATALKDVRENYIHRGQLEDILKKETFRKMMTLYRYSDASQQVYYKLHLQKIEIDLILSRIRALISQSFDSTIPDLPLFLNPYICYDLKKLGVVKTFDELLDVIEKTSYYKVLIHYRVKKGKEKEIVYAKIEHQLLKKYFEESFRIIDKTLRGESRKQCYELLASQVELDNISKIYRLKKYFDVDENVIRKSLFPVSYRIRKAAWEELIQCSLPQFIEKVKTGPYHLPLENSEDLYIEYFIEKYMYKLAKKNVYFAQDAPTVYSSYLILIQTELNNIFSIIEGVRYEAISEDVEQLLVY